MGFTKKSWLALALALVMVFGMAMPTAFAAPNVAPLSFYTDAALNTAAANVHVYDADAGAKTYYLSTGNQHGGVDVGNDRIPMSANGTGDGNAPTYVITGVDEQVISVTSDPTKGTITVTPKGPGTVGNFEFTVRVSSSDNSWKRLSDTTASVTNHVFEQVFQYTVRPVITYTGAPIVFDITGTQTVTLDRSMFSSYVGGVINLPSVAPYSITAAPASLNIGFAGPEDNRTWTLTRNSNTPVTNGTLTIIASVDNVQARTLTVPYVIGDATSTIGYKVGTRKTEMRMKPNAGLTDRTVDIFVADKNDQETISSTLRAAGNTTATVNITKGVSASGAAISTWAFNPTVNATGNRADSITVTIPNDVVSAEGTITINSKAGAGGLTTVDVVSKTIPFIIEPLKLAPGLDSKLTFDINRDSSNTQNVKTILLSTNETGILQTTIASFTAPTTAINTGAVVALVDTNKYTLTAEKAITTKLGDGEISVKGVINPGGYTTETVKIPYTVIDTTQKAKYSSDKTSVDLDMYGTTSMVAHFTMDTGATVAGTPTYTIKDKNGKTMTAAQIAAAGLTITYASPYTQMTIATAGPIFEGVLTIKGNVNNNKPAPNGYVIDFAPVDISIKVDNTEPNVPHHINATPTDLGTKTVGDNPVRVSIPTFDKTPTLLDPTVYVGAAAPVIDFIKADGTVDNVTGYATLTRVGTTWDYDISFLKPFAGTIRFTVGTSPKTATVSIPLTIKGLALTVDKTELVFDRAYFSGAANINLPASKTRQIITISANNTIGAVTPPTFNPTTSGLSVATVTSADPKVVQWSIDLDATTNPYKLASGKIIFSGYTINGVVADDLVINYSIKNTATLVTDAPNGKYDFSLQAGGNKTAVLNVSAFPSLAAIAGLTVASQNPSIVTVTPVVGTPNRFDVKAIASGATLITVDGKVNGVQVDQVVIKVNVDNTQANLVATPNPIVLDLKGTKEVTVALSSTTAGQTVTDGKLTYTGDLVTIAGLKVTAVKAGSGTIAAEGKINGIAASLSIPFTVTDGAVVTGNTFAINGAKVTASSLQYGANAYNTYTLTVVDSNAAPIAGKFTFSSGRTNRIKFYDKASNDKITNSVDVIVVGTGKCTITATPVGSSTTTPVSFQFNVTKKTATAFDVSALNLVIGQKKFAPITLTPAGGRSKGFTYTSSNKDIATVDSKGVVTGKAAGTAEITVKSKGDLGTKKFTVTVSNNFAAINFRAVTLFQNATGVSNANEAGINAGFTAAKYDPAKTAAVETLASNITKEAFIAALNAYADPAKGILDNDVFTFYFSGNTGSTGIIFSDGTMTMASLAKQLAKIPGNVVVYLNCTRSNRMINTKDVLDESEIFTAFAKATAGMTAASSSYKQDKFRVFTSTAKVTQKPGTTATSTATALDYKFDAAVKNALTVTNGFLGADSSKDGFVTAAEMYTYIKTTVKYTSCWPSTKNQFPVYANKGTTPVAP